MRRGGGAGACFGPGVTVEAGAPPCVGAEGDTAAGGTCVLVVTGGVAGRAAAGGCIAAGALGVATGASDRASTGTSWTGASSTSGSNSTGGGGAVGFASAGAENGGAAAGRAVGCAGAAGVPGPRDIRGAARADRRGRVAGACRAGT